MGVLIGVASCVGIGVVKGVVNGVDVVVVGFRFIGVAIGVFVSVFLIAIDVFGLVRVVVIGGFNGFCFWCC